MWLAVGLASPAQAQSPSLSIAGATILEGNRGFRELLFPVTLSSVQTFDVSASFKTRDITATAGSDYTPQLAGQIVIKAGQTRANVLIRVLSDAVEERHETFLVQLGAPKRAFILGSDAIGTVTDDDYNGQISISDTSFTELNSGQKVAKVQVSLSPAPLHDISVGYETKDDSAKATSADYLPARGVLLFKPGRLILTVGIFIIGDTFGERDEKFLVRISSAEFPIAKPLGTIAILNDDSETGSPLPPPVSASIGDVFVEEADVPIGQGETLPETQLLVTLAAPAAQPLEIRYATLDGSAVAGSDYVGKQGVLRFESGQTSASITLQIGGENIEVEEADEAFSVSLAAPGGLTGDATGVVSIRDDDYNGQINVTQPRFFEGDSDQTPIALAIVPSTPPLHPLQISYATLSNPALSDAALSPDDYVTARGTLTIPTGARSVPLPLALVGDTIFEREEIFYIDFRTTFPATNIRFRENRVVVTIRDNDPVPSNLGGKIAFESNRDGNDEIYVMNPDGSNQTRLTDNPNSDRFPALSPDGTRIIWIAESFGDATVWSMNADGSNKKRLFRILSTTDFGVGGDPLSYPRFSPDGSQIVVVSRNQRGTVAGSGLIHVANADGMGVRLVTDRGLFESQAAFSPDGSKILFANLSNHIALIALDGSGETALTSGASFNYQPNFSPDGSKIVFASQANRSDDLRIHIMNADGSARTALPAPLGFLPEYSTPVVSPDGNRIAFSIDPGSGASIGVMGADGSNQKQLAFSDGGQNPSWSIGSVPTPQARVAPSKPSGGGA